MGLNPMAGDIKDQTWRALWEVRNVLFTAGTAV